MISSALVKGARDKNTSTAQKAAHMYERDEIDFCGSDCLVAYSVRRAHKNKIHSRSMNKMPSGRTLPAK
jgi:hypothetical protein